MKLSPSQISIINGIIKISWIIKPIWGYISDTVPIFGFRRKVYLIFLGILQCLFWIFLSFFGFNPIFVAFLLLIIQLCMAFCNVIGEAILVEISRDVEKNNVEYNEKQQISASKNVSLFFGVKYAGILITSYLSGFLLDYLDKTEIFLITSIFPFMMGISGLFLHEKKHITTNEKHNILVEEREIQENNLNDQEELKSNFKIILNFLKNSEIYKPLLCIFLLRCTPSTSTAMFYFYSNELKFEAEFFGQLNLVSSIAGLIGLTIYYTFLKKIDFKKIFISSLFISAFFQFSLLILIFRLNSYIGIPDKYFCIGDSFLINVIAEINLIPNLVYACRLCPKNVEGTMYALILSTINAGFALSSEFGALFIYLLGITQDNYSNLWLLIVLSNLSILLLIPYAFFIEFNKAQILAEKNIRIEIEEFKMEERKNN